MAYFEQLPKFTGSTDFSAEKINNPLKTTSEFQMVFSFT